MNQIKKVLTREKITPSQKIIWYAILIVIIGTKSLSSQTGDVYPGFLNQEVYDFYVRYYTDPDSPEFVKGSDPLLVKTILKLETRGLPWQISRAGALGPAQMMLKTARTIDPSVTRETLLFDIGYAIKLVCIHTVDLSRIIRKEIKPKRRVSAQNARLREKALILGAYNAGFMAVKRYNGIPPFRETKTYVSRGIYIYKQLLKRRTDNG